MALPTIHLLVGPVGGNQKVACGADAFSVPWSVSPGAVSCSECLAVENSIIRRALDVIEKWDARQFPWLPGNEEAWIAYLDSIRDLRAALTAAGYLPLKDAPNGT